MTSYPRNYMLAQFSAILIVGAELQQKNRDWAEIHKALGLLNARLDSLPWELVTAADINLLIRPCQHVFVQFYSVKEGIPHKFAMSILERAAIFLCRTVESRMEFLQADQRHECFLVTLNVMKKGSTKNLELFSDELLDSSLRLLLMILNKDDVGGLSQFGPNMAKGIVFFLREFLDQASRPYAARVTALLLLELCFQRLVTAEIYPQVVPGILSLVIHVLCRNPDTDSTKVLVQALTLTKTVLNQTAIDVASQVQGDWVQAFMKGARAVVKRLDVLLHHNSPLVQQRLLDIYFWAFEDRHALFDKEFKANLLASLLPLAISSQTQDYAFQGLVQAVDSAALAACFNLHHAKLVQVFTSEKEADKTRLMRLLSSAVLALGPAIASHLLNLSDCWLSWCKILLPEEASGVVEVSETRLTLKESSADTRDPHLLCSEIQSLSKEVPLKYIQDQLAFDALIQFFQYLGLYYRHIDTLLLEGTQILSSENMKPYHSAVLRIIDAILLGRKMDVAPLFEFHKTNQACWIQPHDTANIRLALLPAVVEAMDQSEVTSSGLVDFHALHMVAVAAIDHGPNFRLELFSTLYTVIEKVGHPNTSISWAAKHCLKVIELACGYSSLIDLIQDNLDYLIHSVSLRLHPMHIHPPTASMVSALFWLSKGQDLALLDDIFDLVTDGLHASSIANKPSSHTICLFLEVFTNMTMPITRCLIGRERYLLAGSSCQYGYHPYPSDLQAFIAEFKQAKDNYETTLLDETPPQDHLPPPQLSDDVVVKRCHGRLQKLLATASCFISHSSPRCRQLSMQVIAAVAQTAGDLSIAPEIAAQVRHPLDSMWHRVWPGLETQLGDPNPILCELALTTIAAIHAFSPSFLGPRVATQALPKVLALVKDPSASHSLRLSGLRFLISTIQHLESSAFDPWDLYDMIQEIYHLHQAGIPEAPDLIQSKLIPALERNGGPHADLAYMLTSSALKLCSPQTKYIAF
ncbi:TEL2-interacting protein 1 [Entomophthora muscae]|uniref:TEL2-interacting protein 1 n=1 Tax=Entomophthora muscae TaxID=34485 RepID=A0ACC2TES0_9FUNG|nr:TEL2-interacting protein 1 [Entomophthora muscae]